MAVTTEADRLKDVVYINILGTINDGRLETLEDALKKIIDPDTWGADHWSEDFKKQVWKDYKTIQKINRKLRKMKQRY